MNRIAWTAAVSAGLLAGSAAAGQAAPEKPADPPAIPNPVVLLVRDPDVRAELRLSEPQREALDRLLQEHNEPLFALRDIAPGDGGEPVRRLMDTVERRLREILDARQQARLESLVLQAQGLQALLRPEIARRLNLTSRQRSGISRILDETRAALADLQQKAAAGEGQEAARNRLEALKTSQHDRIVALLNERQKRQWLDLAGAKYDFTRFRQSAGRAPELRDVTEWLQSEPLTFEQLRGRVVVLHFFAYG